MNNKLLTILWILIIAGTVFITIHKLKPKSDQLEKPETLTDVTVTKDNKTIDNKNDEVPRKETNKTAADYTKLADEYLENEYYEKAIDNYEKAASLSPNSLEILLKLGDAYLKNNQPDQAKETFTTAAKIKPDSIDIKISLARSELNARQIEKAKEIIWLLDETNNTVKYYKAITLILYKDFDGAKKQFEAIYKADPKPTGDILKKTEKFMEAYTTFSYYKESDKIFLQLLLAKALTGVQENQAAIPLIYDILNTKNNYRDAWIILGYAYLNINKPDDAIDALTQAKDLTPEKPETLFFLGLAHFAKNDLNKAIYYIEQADKYGYEPKEQINLKLGDLYLLKEEYKKSAKKYEVVLKTNTKNMEVFIRAIWINIDKLNDPKKALELAQKAQEKYPKTAMSYNLLGWSYTALGDFDQAKENLQTALSLEPAFDAANLNYGWLYEKQGNALLAKEYYKKAYFLGKGNSIGTLAAVRYNKLTEKELQNYQVDVSAPVER